MNNEDNDDNKYGSHIDNTLLTDDSWDKQEPTDQEYTPYNPASWSIDDMVQELRGKSEEEFNRHFDVLKQAFIDESHRVTSEYREDWHEGGLNIQERFENSEAEPDILSIQLAELQICKEQVADNLGFSIISQEDASSSSCKEDSDSGSSSSDSIKGEAMEVEPSSNTETPTTNTQTPTEYVQELLDTEPMDIFDPDL